MQSEHAKRTIDGFVTDITPEQLEDAPAKGDDWTGDRDWETRTFANFAAPYYWI